jgi:hypothetical protein
MFKQLIVALAFAGATSVVATPAYAFKIHVKTPGFFTKPHPVPPVIVKVAHVGEKIAEAGHDIDEKTIEARRALGMTCANGFPGTGCSQASTTPPPAAAPAPKPTDPSPQATTSSSTATTSTK